MSSGKRIETLHDTVLKLRLVFFDIVHELPYEGPCRFGKGMELERQKHWRSCVRSALEAAW